MKNIENMTREEKETLLQYITDNAIVDLSHIQNEMEMTKRREILKKHKYKIWKSKDGYWQTYLPDEEKGRKLKKRKNKKDLEDLIIDFLMAEIEDPTVEDIFKKWNSRRLEQGLIAKSTYDRNCQIYRRHFTDYFGKLHIKSVEPVEIEDFLITEVSQKALNYKAYSNLKGLILGIFKQAKRDKLWLNSISYVLDDMDKADLRIRKTRKDDSLEVFNESEFQKILAYLKENPDRHNLGILLMFVTGVRVGELVTIKYSDISGSTIKIQRTETKERNAETGKLEYLVKETPKTDAGIRTVIVPNSFNWILEKLNELKTDNEFVFVSKGKRMTTNCIRFRMKRICEKLDIVNKSPHKARKTYATILLDSHIDTKTIEKLMGHTSISCTEQYYYKDRHTLEEKAESINNIVEFRTA